MIRATAIAAVAVPWSLGTEKSVVFGDGALRFLGRAGVPPRGEEQYAERRDAPDGVKTRHPVQRRCVHL